MALKYQAKDTDELEEELEEWSLGVNLFSTEPVEQEVKVVTIDKNKIKEKKTKRSTYKNKDVMDINI
ncbi:MAG: hypothetical protein J6P61_01630 [Erysipelotrichaceae bacterium]|nr:hypothetical protein [Erysipelotrichaceae bacterium]